MGEEKKLFPRVLVLVVLLFCVNVGIFLYSYGGRASVTGNVVVDTFSKAYNETSWIEKIFLIGQWILVGFLVLLVVVRDKKIEKKVEEIGNVKIERKKNETDIDVLYELLKEKKQIKISSISKLFKIKEDVAMNWAKTLESGNLGEIDYPGFGGGAILKLVDKK